MNVMRSCVRSTKTTFICRIEAAAVSWCNRRNISSMLSPWMGGQQRTFISKVKENEVFQSPPWHYQQVRTGKRGTEYQPNNIKRKRTHGWIKRISTQGGIEVILRRMLKGRKSLTH